MKPHTDPVTPALSAVLQPAHDTPSRRARFRLGMFSAVLLVHAAALVGGVLFFSWAGVATALVLVVVTTNLGISAGYHRLLVHRGYHTFWPIRYFLSLCGTLALQGGPLNWSATHRVHHQHAEDDADPHSPHAPRPSFWWGHCLWFCYSYPLTENTEAKWNRYVPDLYREPVLRFMERFFVLINVAFAGALFAAGWAAGGRELGASLVAWGFFVRIVFVWHATWLVNSAAHMWGYRNYNTEDQSRNTWWVALVTSGEGWHNNHHADPRSASHGHKWWEVDPTFTGLRLLEAVGLVWDLRKPMVRALDNKRVGKEPEGEARA